MSNRVQKQKTQQIVKFDPDNVRKTAQAQLQKAMTDGYVNLPEDYKVSTMHAIESMAGLYDIEKVPTANIIKSLTNMFQDQLDYRKNHVYFFVQNDKYSPTGKSLRYGTQYQGLVHIAKQQAGVERVTPVLVHVDDVFERHYQNGALIIDKHIPTFEGDIKGGYCVVEFTDGYRLVKYFTKAELDKRRNRSKAKDGQFWHWEREMYEKTLINGTLKRIIETSSSVAMSDQDSIYADENQEFTTGRVVEDAEIIDQDEPTETAQPQTVEVEELPPLEDANQEPKQATFMM